MLETRVLILFPRGPGMRMRTRGLRMRTPSLGSIFSISTFQPLCATPPGSHSHPADSHSHSQRGANENENPLGENDNPPAIGSKFQYFRNFKFSISPGASPPGSDSHPAGSHSHSRPAGNDNENQNDILAGRHLRDVHIEILNIEPGPGFSFPPAGSHYHSRPAGNENDNPRCDNET